MNSVNNNSTKFMRAALGGLILVLFLAGIFMVVEKPAADSKMPAETNKKWFGTAYISLAGLLGIFYTYQNIVSASNSSPY